MAVLVFAEQRNGALRKSTREAISQGRVIAEGLGVRLFVSLVGEDVTGLTDEVERYGADEVLLSDDPVFSDYRTETYASVLTEAVKEIGAETVLLPHTAMGKDLAPRVAERMGAGLAPDCTGMTLEGKDLIFLRPLYAGKIIESSGDTHMDLMTRLRSITHHATNIARILIEWETKASKKKKDRETRKSGKKKAG